MNEIHVHNKRKTITDFFFQLSLIDTVSSPLTSLSSGSGLQEGDIPFTILKGIEKTFIGKKENVDIYMYEVCSKLYRNEFIETKQLMLEGNLFFKISPHSSCRFECTFRSAPATSRRPSRSLLWGWFSAVGTTPF
jgi:hypothetical protein